MLISRQQGSPVSDPTSKVAAGHQWEAKDFLIFPTAGLGWDMLVPKRVAHWTPTNWWLGGGNSKILYVHPFFSGEMIQFDSYFSDGLKPPTSWWVCCFFLYEPYALGIQSPKVRMVLEPKYYAFRRWLDTPIILWQGDWIPSDGWECTRVSMEIGKWFVSWFITYLGDLQPTYIGVIIHLLSIMVSWRNPSTYLLWHSGEMMAPLVQDFSPVLDWLQDSCNICSSKKRLKT